MALGQGYGRTIAPDGGVTGGEGFDMGTGISRHRRVEELVAEGGFEPPTKGL
jgi:hypothetical protein